MTDHKGLPVAGYKPQKEENVKLVNENKVLEEKCLRQIDKMNKQNMDAEAQGIGRSGQHDPRMMALAKTGIQEAFMWMNRAVFQPDRIELRETLENLTPDEIETVLALRSGEAVVSPAHRR